MMKRFPKRKRPKTTTLQIFASAVLVSLSLILLSACGSDNETGPNDQNFSANIEPLPTPNFYRVVLKWNTQDAPDAWLLHRRLGDEKFQVAQLATLESKVTTYVDGNVTAGETYTYFLGGNFDSQYKVVGKVAVSIPKDVEIRGVTTQTKIEGINRLFFAKDSRLITNGQDLTINVVEIISDFGAIETFPQGQTAPSGGTGRVGGNITIRARKGTGRLSIFARGENGGVGTSGPTGVGGAKGGRGNNGVCGYEGDDSVCAKTNRQQFDEIRRLAQQGGIFGDLYRQILRRFHCRVPTGNGAWGNQGAPGGKGTRGGNGGDSAKVYVEIADPSQIQVQPHALAGRGGIGGEGGSGGPGGPGGDPGTPDHLNLCRWASVGPVGAVGPRGPQGDRGSDGTPRPICMKLSSATLGDCDGFNVKK